MADEFQDDEYHFTEPGSQSTFDTQAVLSDERLPKISMDDAKKYVLYGVGGLVGLFILIKIGSAIFSSPKKGSPSQKQQAKIEQPKPKPTVEPRVASSASQTDNTNISDKLSSLENASQQASDSINSLDNNVNDLQKDLNQLTGKISVLNDNISILSNQVRQQQLQLATLKKKPKKKERFHFKPPKIHYFIQAVIPGRAWLKTNRGKTVTVRKGTVIAGLGRVTNINAKIGEVTTSSGKTISFAPHDL